MASDPSAVFEDTARALLRGNCHVHGLRTARLFDVDRDFLAALQNEVRDLLETADPSEVGDSTHVTNWTRPRGRAIQFSLLNKSGDFNDTSADHTKTRLGKVFHHRDRLPTIGTLIDVFPDAYNFRLNLLGPSGALSPHEEELIIDDDGGVVRLRCRFHLPVFTNDDATVMVDGRRYHFDEGSIYAFNNGCVHSAENGGDRDRLHFVWDMLLTEPATTLMFGDAPMTCRFLERRPRESRTVPTLTQQRVGRFETVAEPRLYRLLRLKALRMRPDQYVRLVGPGRYLFLRLARRVEPFPPAHSPA